MPTTGFFTADGRVLSGWAGAIAREKLAELIEDLLQEFDK